MKFVDHLVKIVDMCSQDIAHWNTQGNRFEIVDNPKFIELIDKSLLAFKRQLNYYGLSRHKTKKVWVFFHPYFLKGKPELYNKIKIISTKHKISTKKKIYVLEKKIMYLTAISNELTNKMNDLQYTIDKIIDIDEPLFSMI